MYKCIYMYISMHTIHFWGCVKTHKIKLYFLQCLTVIVMQLGFAGSSIECVRSFCLCRMEYIYICVRMSVGCVYGLFVSVFEYVSMYLCACMSVCMCVGSACGPFVCVSGCVCMSAWNRLRADHSLRRGRQLGKPSTRRNSRKKSLSWKFYILSKCK